MRWGWLSVLSIALVMAGCGASDGYRELQLVDVSGRVTLDGNPLVGALVRFEGSDKSGSEGTTDSQGNYRLMYDSEHAGCKPGPKTVRITQANADVEGADPDALAGGEGALAAETIPASYNRQSTLVADVSESDATFDFDLKSQP